MLFRDLCTFWNLREHRVQLKIDGRYPVVHEQWRINIEICGFKAHWAWDHCWALASLAPKTLWVPSIPSIALRKFAQDPCSIQNLFPYIALQCTVISCHISESVLSQPCYLKGLKAMSAAFLGLLGTSLLRCSSLPWVRTVSDYSVFEFLLSLSLLRYFHIQFWLDVRKQQLSSSSDWMFVSSGSVLVFLSRQETLMVVIRFLI